jgi:hypothetical protein
LLYREGAWYREVVARQSRPYLHQNMAPQVEKTWTRLCESKHPHLRAPSSRKTEGVECPRSLGSQQPEVGRHCAHPVVAAGSAKTPAALGQAGGAVQSRQPLLQPCWVVLAAATVVRYH